jgi:peptidoglycan hydrolase-like protein with peptidoglycan-binding domain
MILKKGSKGNDVKELQRFLGIKDDGNFGPGTEAAVKKWQAANGLTADGIVGPATWNAMGVATTDASEKVYTTTNGLIVNRYYMPTDEYLQGPIKPEWVFLHHTAGWHNPYNTIDNWAKDTRGRIATEFVLGGPSVRGNDDKYDGVMVQAFPEGNYGWHLGQCGSQKMHKNSVGIEVCNFGYVVNGKTYAGTQVTQSQTVELAKPFRGHKIWHRYSDAQIESLRLWILWIAERDNIDVRAGLPALIKKNGAAAFEWNEDAYYGKVKGLWTHTNTRKDKVDMFPQQELMDMLTNL